MDGLISGHKRTYDDFKKQVAPAVKPLYEEIRNYCLSLGTNVVEDVRMHRIVFCKSMAFRGFADVAPERESVIVKIRRERKEPVRELEIRQGQDIAELKELLADAYNNIR